jgi:hypothetical protein
MVRMDKAEVNEISDLKSQISEVRSGIRDPGSEI